MSGHIGELGIRLLLGAARLAQRGGGTRQRPELVVALGVGDVNVDIASGNPRDRIGQGLDLLADRPLNAACDEQCDEARDHGDGNGQPP